MVREIIKAWKNRCWYESEQDGCSGGTQGRQSDLGHLAAPFEAESAHRKNVLQDFVD